MSHKKVLGTIGFVAVGTASLLGATAPLAMAQESASPTPVVSAVDNNSSDKERTPVDGIPQDVLDNLYSLAEVATGSDWNHQEGDLGGALMISQIAWDDFKEEGFANKPSEATKEQQLKVGFSIYSAQGWSAWHQAPLAGLYDAVPAPQDAPVQNSYSAPAQDVQTYTQAPVQDYTQEPAQQDYTQPAPVQNTAPEPQAAPVANGGVWDQLAQCESGGNWGINTGNGFSGGLQFHPQTWAGYGGTQYAPDASQATREQQIAVAEKVQASQGWGAWPGCTSKLGIS